MKTHGCILVILFTAAIACTLAPHALAGTSLPNNPLPSYSDINVRTANTEGISFDVNHNGMYYINQYPLPNAAFNAVHISTSPGDSDGQITASSAQSGVFYVTDDGGRSYQDDIVIMLAVNGTIPDDFSVHIRSSGYHWVPSGVKDDPPLYANITYKSGALDETFTKADLIYGPQNWKPTAGNDEYPIFPGENMGDPGNQFYLMFIDTHVGVLGTQYNATDHPGQNTDLANDGTAKIEYSFNDLQSFAAFNVYAWNWNTQQGQGMMWTNKILPTDGSGSGNGGGKNSLPSSYTVTGVAPTPTPSPSTVPAVTYDLSLNAGYNMVSLPIVPSDNSITGIFPAGQISNVDVIWDYNGGNWKYWTTEAGYTNQFSTLSPLRGYIIYCYSPMVVHITGTGASGPIPWSQLSQGYNLIGFPSTTSVSIGSTYGSADVIWKLENGNWYYWTTESGYTNQFDTLSPGLGYMVYKN